jgi:hypothetical protein
MATRNYRTVYSSQKDFTEMRLAGRVNSHKILVGKPEGKRQFRRHNRRLEDNI